MASTAFDPCGAHSKWKDLMITLSQTSFVMLGNYAILLSQFKECVSGSSVTKAFTLDPRLQPKGKLTNNSGEITILASYEIVTNFDRGNDMPRIS